MDSVRLAMALAGLATLACTMPALLSPPDFVTHVPPRSDAITSPPVDLRAGASIVDLTPIPGIPLGGYAVEAKISRGFWTRLSARSIFLEDANGKSLALVTTDLMIMPAALVDRVVELLQKPTTGLPGNVGDPLTRIGRENLLLAATETHQSPGNFFDSKLYNSYSSAEEGFDEELFEFLARKITQGIKLAYAARRPAMLRTSHFTGPSSGDYVIDKFVRNRSMDAFLLNPEAQGLIAANASLTPCPVTEQSWPADYPDPRACQAVHARVDLLELVDAGTSAPIALAVFVPTHITVLDAQTEVYAGDVFALAATKLEARVLHGPGCGASSATAMASPSPVVGIFNGAQGDVSLQWRRHDREQAIALAQQLVDHVCGRLAAGLRSATLPTSLDFQFDYISVKDRPFPDPQPGAKGYPRKTEAKPAMGAAELGGAEDQRTLFYELGQKEGVRNKARREHGVKHSPLQIELLGSTWDPVGDEFRSHLPPDRAPLGVYQIADIYLVGFPSEPTTAMGLRIRQQVAAAMSLSSPEQVLLVSFANGHISYVTTPEEYDRQTYEGASNYWGPATGPLLQSEADRLAQALKTGSSPSKPWTLPYWVGKTKTFDPTRAWGPTWDPDEGLANIAVQRGDAYRHFPSFCWRDAIASLRTKGPSPSCDRVVPDVRIYDVGAGQTMELDGLSQDNHGFGLVTAMVAVSTDETEWCAVWLRDDTAAFTGASASASMCRFEVARTAGGPVSSADFPCKGAGPLPRPQDTLGNPLTPLVPSHGTSIWCMPPLDQLGYCPVCEAGELSGEL